MVTTIKHRKTATPTNNHQKTGGPQKTTQLPLLIRVQCANPEQLMVLY
ncbi:MAG: hypothetical protein IPN94_23325 [Sphingobacteriales bacterium]|nr:hypothetical protein [Sphingobacteriales bacterium]